MDNLRIMLEVNVEVLSGRVLNIYVPGWENATALHTYDGLEVP
jgi:hypothetical protein